MFYKVRLEKIKVVILGYEPYSKMLTENEPEEQGLSFSISKEAKVNINIQNIYTELENDIHGFCSPDHGDLSEWCNEDVFLLNSHLTCDIGQSKSHAEYGIWLKVIPRVLLAISKINPKCIYILLGKQSQEMSKYIGSKSIILETSFPSISSARRGFFGSKIFSKCNDELIKQGKTPVNWCITNK